MSATFYKKYFEIQLYHESDTVNVCSGLGILPTEACERFLSGNGLGYKAEPGKITVYYSGTEYTPLIPLPIVDPPTRQFVLYPSDPIPDTTELFFTITYLDKDIIEKIDVPASVDMNTYFPPDPMHPVPIPWTLIRRNGVALEIPGTGAPDPGVLTVERVEFKNVLGVNTMTHVPILSQTLAKNTDGNFNCTVDLSDYPSAVYYFALPPFTRYYYIDTCGDTLGKYGVYRVIKNLDDAGTWDIPPSGVVPPVTVPVTVLTDATGQTPLIFKYTFPAPP